MTNATANELLPPGVRDALAFGSGLRTPYERDLSIDEVFTDAARSRPSACAIVGDDGTFTYEEVERGSNRIANALAALGVKPGAAVGVAFERSTKLPLVLLGILKAGAAYVPLDPAYPLERTVWMIEDASVSLAVVNDQLALSDAPVARVSVNELLESQHDERPYLNSGATSLAYVLYTSGSTGRPKGVAVEHRAVVRLVRSTDYISVAPDDVFLQCAPLAFDASTFEIWAPLLNGARLAVPSPGLVAMDELAKTIDRFHVTTMWLTTSLFHRLIDAAPARPRSLRTLLTGGEAGSPPHMARFLQSYPGCRLVNIYGPTENTSFSTWRDITLDDTRNSSVPIGKPVANSTAFVLDGDLKPLPPGVEGELFLGGDGVARGYVNRPELTSERFVVDPFADDADARLYRTGDRARWRSDGVLEFLGRNDDQVKLRGFRIELGEIEAALQKHQAVKDAAVVVAQRDGEKELAGYAVLYAANSADERDLRAWLSRTLPAFMIPHRIAIRSELPLTSSGKIDRVALARTPVVTTGSGIRFAPPPHLKMTETEREIADLWREILHCEAAPGLDENFFDAGGDSLRMLALHARLRERFGSGVSVTDLFEHCTIHKLAAFVRGIGVRA